MRRSEEMCAVRQDFPFMNTPPEQTTADKLLLERCRSGDKTALNEMVSTYWDRIFSRVFGLLKNREDAEEVTQDTFIRAQRGLDNFRGEASFSTWLYQIATNLAHNRYWFWWRRKRHASMSLDQSLTHDESTSLHDILPSGEQDPLQAHATQELVDEVAKAMERINPSHREILTLRNVKNLSYEEIADTLGINVGTVKSRIARARESLRAAMGSEFR